MPLKAVDFGDGCGVPEPGYPVVTAGEQCGAVRGKRNALEPISMTLEAAGLGAGCDAPESGCSADTAGEQRGAVRGKSNACDEVRVAAIDLNRQR